MHQPTQRLCMLSTDRTLYRLESYKIVSRSLTHNQQVHSHATILHYLTIQLLLLQYYTVHCTMYCTRRHYMTCTEAHVAINKYIGTVLATYTVRLTTHFSSLE